MGNFNTNTGYEPQMHQPIRIIRQAPPECHDPVTGEWLDGSAIQAHGIDIADKFMTFLVQETAPAMGAVATDSQTAEDFDGWPEDPILGAAERDNDTTRPARRYRPNR